MGLGAAGLTFCPPSSILPPMYYPYRQNNTRGTLTGPASTVWIEADNAEEANQIFVTLDGCYFDPDYKRDCECCGTRWYGTDEYYGMSHYDMLMKIDSDGNSSWKWKSISDAIGRSSIPQHMVRHKDGHVQFI